MNTRFHPHPLPPPLRHGTPEVLAQNSADFLFLKPTAKSALKNIFECVSLLKIADLSLLHVSVLDPGLQVLPSTWLAIHSSGLTDPRFFLQ
jgi:hypothetical protein